jgi:hypothetical protein
MKNPENTAFKSTQFAAAENGGPERIEQARYSGCREQDYFGS